MAGPFNRIGIDVIQFKLSHNENQYAVVVNDYLTKWPEVFAVSNQLVFAIDKLIMKEVVSRHGVPSEILSDCVRSFLSGLMVEVEKFLGFKKVNTMTYHPQTDALVERYKRTLKVMLATTVTDGGDKKILYALIIPQYSIVIKSQRSSFYMAVTRDCQLKVLLQLSHWWN